MNVRDHFATHTCSGCGKEIYLLHATAYRYRKKTKRGVKYCCSWSCFRKEEKKEESAKCS